MKFQNNTENGMGIRTSRRDFLKRAGFTGSIPSISTVLTDSRTGGQQVNWNLLPVDRVGDTVDWESRGTADVDIAKKVCLLAGKGIHPLILRGTLTEKVCWR